MSNLLYQKLIENKTTVFDKTILIDKQGKYTYRSLDTLVKKIGMLFLKMKLGKGSRIIVVTDGTVHSVAAILACIAYGVVFVPCAKEQNINYIRKDCDAEGVVDRDGFLLQSMEKGFHGKRSVMKELLLFAKPIRQTIFATYYIHLDRLQNQRAL